MAVRMRGASALLAGVSGVALLMAGSGGIAIAQNISTQNVQVLDAITVGATKTAEKSIDSLSANTVVSQDEIARIAPRRVEDLYTLIPGVWTQQRGDSPEAAINIRGMQDFGRVAVVVDGARQNFQRSGHNANGSFLIDPELLASLDVVRGPVANVYGSGAIGGVASFRTKDVDDVLRPGENWGGLAHTVFGTNPVHPVTSGFAAVRMTPNVEAIVGGAYRTLDRYKDGRGTEVENSGFDLGSGLAKITVKPADGHKIKLTGITQKSDYDTGQFTGLAASDRESVYRTTLTNDIVSARWTYSRPEDRMFDFDGNVYRTRTQQEQVKIQGSNSPITGPVGNVRSFSIDTVGFDAHNTSRFDTGAVRHAVTLGADHFRDEVENIDPAGNGVVTTPNGERTVGGGFLQWKMNYMTWLEFVGAVRYDNYQLSGGGTSTSGDRISPKGTLGVTPWQGITFYGTYAEGYRAPAVTETLVNGGHPPFAAGFPNLFTFVPNPGLKPEVGKTKEIGVNLKFDGLLQQGDAFRGKINVFRNDVDDYIELVNFGPPINFTFCPAPVPGCPPVPTVTIPINTTSFVQYRNIEQARLEGVELEASYDQGRWFVQAAGQHITGKDMDANIPLINAPPDKLTLGFGMRFFDRKLTTLVRWIGVDGKKASDIPDRGGDGTPDALPTGGYGLVNLYLTYQPIEDVQINFSVENVFDRYYVPYLAESSNRAFAGPGIAFKGGLQIRFGDSFYKNAKSG